MINMKKLAYVKRCMEFLDIDECYSGEVDTVLREFNIEPPPHHAAGAWLPEVKYTPWSDNPDTCVRVRVWRDHPNKNIGGWCPYDSFHPLTETILDSLFIHLTHQTYLHAAELYHKNNIHQERSGIKRILNDYGLDKL